jgi:hypothetical protein
MSSSDDLLLPLFSGERPIILTTPGVVTNILENDVHITSDRPVAQHPVLDEIDVEKVFEDSVWFSEHFVAD